MVSFPISPKKQAALAAQMQRLGVRESDLEERFIRAGGPGGQNVNKVATCVVLRHLPSGLDVRCEQERSQALNRFLARRILLNRLEAQRIAKIRRQKRKRSKRAKEKLLQDKFLRAQKKSLRGPVGLD